MSTGILVSAWADRTGGDGVGAGYAEQSQTGKSGYGEAAKRRSNVGRMFAIYAEAFHLSIKNEFVDVGERHRRSTVRLETYQSSLCWLTLLMEFCCIVS
jgi:hypothetical protein